MKWKMVRFDWVLDPFKNSTIRTNRIIGRSIYPQKLFSYVFPLIIRIHKNYLPMCSRNYSFLISRLEHSYDRMFHFSCIQKGMTTSLVRRYVDYILFCYPTNIATSNYGPWKWNKCTHGTICTCACSRNTCNMETLSVIYVWSRWNIWNLRLQRMYIATATYATSR
jgi:hypothetical protein